MPPVVLTVTSRLPGVAVQLMEKLAVSAPLAGTLTVRDVPFATVQLPATPDRTTVWLPVATVSVMVSRRPIGCSAPASTAKV